MEQGDKKINPPNSVVKQKMGIFPAWSAMGMLPAGADKPFRHCCKLFFLRRHYPDQVLGYDLSLCDASAYSWAPRIRKRCKVREKNVIGKIAIKIRTDFDSSSVTTVYSRCIWAVA